MITFMQKNKKYLVITIWISVIAFVGASFVGWGSVDLNLSRSGNVAKVGKIGITEQEFAKRFENMLHFYNQNGELDKDTAISMGLDRQALIELIREKLLLNYAMDLGLGVSDDELMAYISSNAAFFQDGKFDKNTYLQVLKQNKISPVDYENSMKNSILLNKVYALFDIKSTPEEIEMAISSVFMQDLLGIKIIKLDRIDIDDDELKTFWEDTKQDYMTEKTYELSYYLEKPSTDITFDENEITDYYNENRFDFKDGNGEFLALQDVKEDIIKQLNKQNTKKNANLTYVALKNGEKQFDEKMTIDVSEADIINNIGNLSIGEIARPFQADKFADSFVVVRLDSINEPRNKTYDEAKDDVMTVYKEKKLKEELEKLAKSYNGNYKNIGFVNRDTTKSTLSGLSEMEFAIFINKVFSSNKKQSYVVLDDKAVAYKILEQRLDNPNKIDVYQEAITKQFDLLKKASLLDGVLEELQKRYQVTNYYKGSLK